MVAFTIAHAVAPGASARRFHASRVTSADRRKPQSRPTYERTFGCFSANDGPPSVDGAEVVEVVQRNRHILGADAERGLMPGPGRRRRPHFLRSDHHPGKAVVYRGNSSEQDRVDPTSRAAAGVLGASKTSFVLPAWMTRPSSIRTVRSASVSASTRSWLTM